jgi:hypothetical protein
LSWHLDPAPWRFAGNSRESPGGTPPARSVIINSEFNNGFVSCANIRDYMYALTWILKTGSYLRHTWQNHTA